MSKGFLDHNLFHDPNVTTIHRDYTLTIGQRMFGIRSFGQVYYTCKRFFVKTQLFQMLPEQMLPGQMLPGQMLPGLMLYGQMLYGQILVAVNSVKLLFRWVGGWCGKMN